MTLKTTDLSDAHPDVSICEPLFRSYGGRAAFSGAISTVKCHEDNSLLKEAVSFAGNGHVLVVDGGGSKRCALMGDMLGDAAVKNGWAGVIIFGCVRDSVELAKLKLGVLALATNPLKSEKRGAGQRDVPVRFGGVTFNPGSFVYVDEDGVIVSAAKLA
ncbi:MAG: ribonuclease E activity regulator RraA [Myxococcaceae bacterium]